MKRFITLCIFFFLYACAPAVHRNTTFLKTHHIDARLHNALDSQIGDTLIVSGMTSTMRIAGNEYAIIHYLSANNQLVFVPVDSLAAPEAENIRLTGVVHQKDESSFPTLFPIAVTRLYSFQHYIQHAQLYTAKLKDDLPSQTYAEWIAFEYEQNVIVFMQSADVMNACHLDFIFNKDKRTLTDVYIEKRFKGE